MTTLCPHFGICGGCSIQNLTYDAQLQKKQQLVTEFLSGIPIESFLPIRPSPDIYFYRNKMEFSFGDLKDIEILQTPKGQKADLSKPEFLTNNQVHLGLHPRKRFNLVTPTPNCLLMSQESQAIMQIISSWATQFQIPTYVRTKNQGILRHVLMREGKNTNERLVALVAQSALKEIDSLVERLKNSGVAISSFLWIQHDGLSDTVTGTAVPAFWGHPYIHERVGKINFRVPLKSFMQTNTHASEQMIQLLSSWMSEGPQPDVIFDLYCGVGTIGLNLASQANRVVGIELDASAIEEAYFNAKENQVENVTFLVGRTENLIAQLSEHSISDNSLLIVDPPRAGLHQKVIDALLMMKLPRIFYVSCNPESLARDLRLLGARYTIRTVQPLDFFPHTDHVETAVRLQLQ